MIAVRSSLAVAFVLAFGSAASAQDFPPKPGPEHKELAKWVGNWDATMKMMGMETKCSASYKMDLGGLWLSSSFEGDLGGVKFSGRGMDTFDPAKKKYVSVWIDSFSAAPMILEGAYDEKTKELVLAGEGPGEGGKNIKYKSVSKWNDENTATFTMYMGDAKEPAFTIVYKRKK